MHKSFTRWEILKWGQVSATVALSRPVIFDRKENIHFPLGR